MMGATPIALATLTEPPCGPSSVLSRRLYEWAGSWNRFSTFCKATTAAIRLTRFSRGSSTCTTSSEPTGADGDV
jgi:hypothetical protein